MQQALIAEHGLSPSICPHCGVAAKQEWFQRLAGLPEGDGLPVVFDGYHVAQCHHCGRPNLWHLVKESGDDARWKLVYPEPVQAPPPAENMPTTVLHVYLEARAIAHQSPRAAAALLRLAVELLLDHLGAEGKTLNDKVGWLVRRGVARNVQQAFDGVRVCGNKAAHALQIIADDPREVSDLLFRLVNYVVETLVTGQQELERFYQRLPDASRRAIRDRDTALGNEDAGREPPSVGEAELSQPGTSSCADGRSGEDTVVGSEAEPAGEPLSVETAGSSPST